VGAPPSCCGKDMRGDAEDGQGEIYVSIRQHTPAHASTRQHTSAYVSIRQHTPGYLRQGMLRTARERRRGNSCLRRAADECHPARHADSQLTAAPVSASPCSKAEQPPHTCRHQHTSAYDSIRQHTSAYVSVRQRTSAYVSVRQHTSAYVSMRGAASAYLPPPILLITPAPFLLLYCCFTAALLLHTWRHQSRATRRPHHCRCRRPIPHSQETPE
jgi:hypothetical protein